LVGILGNYPSTADNGTYTAGDGTNGVCANLDCHNEKSTTTAFDWYDGAATSCTMCHTVAGAGANPTTGLHNVTAAGYRSTTTR